MFRFPGSLFVSFFIYLRGQFICGDSSFARIPWILFEKNRIFIPRCFNTPPTKNPGCIVSQEVNSYLPKIRGCAISQEDFSFISLLITREVTFPRKFVHLLIPTKNRGYAFSPEDS